jgi:biopolymer transport protein ExbB/TolQ
VTPYSLVVSLFYELANLFFWPVAVALLLLLALTLSDLGRLFYQVYRRQSAATTDLVELARRLHHARGRVPALDGVSMSPSLARFSRDMAGRLTLLPPDAPVDLWLEEALQQREIAVTSSLDKSRALVRLGPMLGLAGTIIPLGPALQALLTGDMAGMVNHLVVGFGAVVCGLVLSGIAYGVTLVRERWARVDLKELENFCELVMRAQPARAPLPALEEELAAI